MVHCDTNLRDVTHKAIRRGVFKHVRELQAAIEAYLVSTALG